MANALVPPPAVVCHITSEEVVLESPSDLPSATGFLDPPREMLPNEGSKNARVGAWRLPVNMAEGTAQWKNDISMQFMKN